MAELKENYDLVEKDLNVFDEDFYTRFDIVDMIEISYMLAKRQEMELFNEIQEIAFDGINTYGLFVKFVYDKYCKRGIDDIYCALDDLKETIQEFKEKYYMRIGE